MTWDRKYEEERYKIWKERLKAWDSKRNIPDLVHALAIRDARIRQLEERLI